MIRAPTCCRIVMAARAVASVEKLYHALALARNAAWQAACVAVRSSMWFDAQISTAAESKTLGPVAAARPDNPGQATANAGADRRLGAHRQQAVEDLRADPQPLPAPGSTS